MIASNGQLNGDVPPQNHGGQGDAVPLALTDDHHTRAGLALVRRAIRQRWGVKDAHRERVPDLLMELAEDVQNDGRVRVAALKTMRDIEADNQKDDHAEAGLKDQSAPTTNVVNVIKVEFDSGG